MFFIFYLLLLLHVGYPVFFIADIIELIIVDEGNFDRPNLLVFKILSFIGTIRFAIFV